MIIISAAELTHDLLSRLDTTRQKTESFNQYSAQQLEQQPGAGSWSANQCFDHMHIVQTTYLQNISKALVRFKGKDSDNYSEGLIGGWFYKKMLPIKAGSKSSKVKTFKKLEPSNNPQARVQFLESLTLLENQLKDLQNQNLEKVRVTSLAGPILKFKLGDAYRIIIAHNERHLAQAARATQV